ncbi:MAG: hypothetical protein R2844_03365 [Caldilineales bacterium]
MTTQHRSDRSGPQTPAPLPAANASAVDLDSTHVWWGSIYGALIGMGLALAGLAIGFGVTGLTGDTRSYWYLSRAAGVVAYLLLWGSVAWGLLLSSRIGKGRLRPPVLLDAHQFLSSLAIGFALFHGLILMGDHYLSFPLSAVLVPFASSYKPALVAGGQIGLWLSVLVAASFYVRRRIGQKRWRTLHYTSFVAFWAVLIHSVFIGSESGQPLLAATYVATAGAVLFLTFYRIFARDGKERAPMIAGN